LVRGFDGSALYYAIQVDDITDLVNAERSLRESEQRFRTILEIAEEGIVAVDAGQVVRFANRRMAELLGVEVADLLDRPVAELLHHVDLATVDRSGWDAGRALRFESRVRRTDGVQRWVQVATSPNSWPIDGAMGTVVTITDIDDLKSAEAELRHRSTHDPLTGLANRALLEAFWDERGEDTDGDGAIVLDLDGFKRVNDTFGHAEGDRVLVDVAGLLTATVRRLDVVARLGGDEFVVVCRQSHRSDVEHLAGRLVEELNRSFQGRTPTRELGASAGVAIGRAGVGHRELLREADVALYEAKRRGGRQACSLTDP
jgi:diguanylate cyclase (GGDEF)-like protein/PAS domain S-box-containing protein